MRTAIVLALLLPACAAPTVDEIDGGWASMMYALDAEPQPDEAAAEDDATRVLPPEGRPSMSVREEINQTLDCPDGGTVSVYLRRTANDDPYKREGTIQWQYAACGTWEYGTIDGHANVSKSVAGGPPWSRELHYNAALTYSGGAQGECNAYNRTRQTWRTSQHQLTGAATCPHPVREWWGMLGI